MIRTILQSFVATIMESTYQSKTCVVWQADLQLGWGKLCLTR
jgi:hypothetical protein